jgi:hypothetical protein
MSDGELHACAGLLGSRGLGLVVLAVFGFDQRFFARVLDGLAGLASFGSAAYLWRVTPSLSRLWYLVFLALAPLTALLIRERRRARRRRLAAGLLPQMYVAPPPPTALTPFPPPPPPLGAASASAPHAEPEPQRRTYQPLPSGLPRKPAPDMPGSPPPDATGPERPAGPDPAALDQTSSRLRRPAYLEPRPAAGGRHRASEPDDEAPPGQ